MIVKAVGVWLVADAVGSWLYDTRKILQGEHDPPHLVEHAVRFIRALIGAVLVAIG